MMKIFFVKQTGLILSGFLMVSLAHAEVVTDGSLGLRMGLEGSVYDIHAGLGTQVGSHLFHSFEQFNIFQGETATFSGPPDIQNVISRVTGGSSSLIDGTVRNTISGAETYLINPYGIVFGENAKLDVQGGFHVSTADYLHLQDGGQFNARSPNDSVLSMAPVEAFGFLTDTPAPIRLQSSQLTMPTKENITLVGGDFTMKQASLNAPGGDIKVASVASQGEVVLLESDLQLSSFEDLGDVSITGDGSAKGDVVLTVNDEETGLILIRGGNMLLSNRAFIEAHNNTDFNKTDLEKGINIKLSGELKLVGTSDIQAKTLTLDSGTGQTAPIIIEVDRLELWEGSQITSSVWGVGQGHHLTIKANEILLSGLSDLTITTRNDTRTRNASGISSVSNSLNPNALESTINIEAKHVVIEKQAQINVASTALGHAGSIHLKTEHLEVTEGGGILSTAVGLGDGGAIHINADKITLSEVGSINSSGFGPGQGNAGEIIIEANHLELINGGNINISTLGLGESGVIELKISDTLHLSGQADERQFFVYDFVNEQIGGLLLKLGVKPEDLVGPSKISAAVIHLGSKAAGTINIQAGQLSLQNNATITSEHRGTGDAGDIALHANDIRLTQGTITTETFGGGGGGNISINTPGLLYLRDASITTSVGTGQGQGGEISIENPTFVTLNQGEIKAQANEGQGGNIRIVTDQYLKSTDSLISASSRLGIDGRVEITAPELNISESTFMVSGQFLVHQQTSTCSADTTNRYTIRHRGGVPPLENDLQAVKPRFSYD